MPASTVRPYAVHPLILGILMRHAKVGDRESFAEIIRQIYAEVDINARVDELERVRKATLDSDQDVWSTQDDDTVISLPDRLIELRKF